MCFCKVHVKEIQNLQTFIVWGELDLENKNTGYLNLSRLILALEINGITVGTAVVVWLPGKKTLQGTSLLTPPPYARYLFRRVDQPKKFSPTCRLMIK